MLVTVKLYHWLLKSLKNFGHDTNVLTVFRPLCATRITSCTTGITKRATRGCWFLFEWYCSVLGALLFSIYVNNLQSVECSIVCNVDDTIKFSPLQWRNLVPQRIKSLMTYNESMFGALRTISCWTRIRQSSWFSAVNRWFVNLWTLKLSFLDEELLPTDSVKDLGVIFDPVDGFHCDVIKL